MLVRSSLGESAKPSPCIQPRSGLRKDSVESVNGLVVSGGSPAASKEVVSAGASTAIAESALDLLARLREQLGH